MAEITPFQGVRYNQDLIKDLSDVICPPYDVISPEEQKLLYEKSEYNIVRLEHGITLPGDNEHDNKYTRAAQVLTQWLNTGILKIDRDHTFYIYEQGFNYNGNFKKRLGLISCVRLEPFSRRVILPHEDTSASDKTDRLDLMRALNANISPILGLYDDPGNKITKLMADRMLPGRLLININNGDETHRIWKANEPEFVQRVSHFMLPKSIYIADGHHRYETALAYREERLKKSVVHSGEGFNYILMVLVSFSDSGILMLPVHRVVKKLTNKILQDFKKNLSTYFNLNSCPLTPELLENRQGTDIRILGLDKNIITIAKLKENIPTSELFPAGHSQIYYHLDVSIVEHIILQKLLAPAYKPENIIYTANSHEAYKWLNQGNAQLVFLLNMLPVSTIKSITDAGDRMPRKSTYFYPKLPTGLVFNRLEGIL